MSAVDVLSSSSPAAAWSKTPFTSDPRILSASYDGLLRIWSQSGTILATSVPASQGGHTAGIKAAKFLSPTSIVSAGLDRTIRVWNYSEASKPEEQGKLSPNMILYGHTLPVDSIAVHGPTNRILSASADGSIGLWNPAKGAPAAPVELLPGAAPSAKRRKMNTAVDIPARGALNMIAAHTSPATGVIFHPDDSTVGYSTSLDHSLKTLDLVTGVAVDSRQTSHSLLSLCTISPGGSGHVVAVGTAARHITLLDPRVDAKAASVMTLRGHTNKVVSLSADPHSQYGLVSGSHDGTVRVWDIRNYREGTREEGGRVGEAVFVVDRESAKGEDGEGARKVGGEGVKVLSVVWDKELGIVSGSEDRKVQINKGSRVVNM